MLEEENDVKPVVDEHRSSEENLVEVPERNLMNDIIDLNACQSMADILSVDEAEKMKEDITFLTGAFPTFATKVIEASYRKHKLDVFAASVELTSLLQHTPSHSCCTSPDFNSCSVRNIATGDLMKRTEQLQTKALIFGNALTDVVKDFCSVANSVIQLQQHRAAVAPQTPTVSPTRTASECAETSASVMIDHPSVDLNFETIGSEPFPRLFVEKENLLPEAANEQQSSARSKQLDFLETCITNARRDSYQKMTNSILSKMFSPEYLASHSLCGYMNRDKPALDTAIVLRIIDGVRAEFPSTSVALIRCQMVQKMNNCFKIFQKSKQSDKLTTTRKRKQAHSRKGKTNTLT